MTANPCHFFVAVRVGTLLAFTVAAILLGGLLLNALFGWWWADPVAGLVMVPIIAKQGVESLKGKACCDGFGCH